MNTVKQTGSYEVSAGSSSSCTIEFIIPDNSNIFSISSVNCFNEWVIPHAWLWSQTGNTVTVKVNIKNLATVDTLGTIDVAIAYYTLNK